MRPEIKHPRTSSFAKKTGSGAEQFKRLKESAMREMTDRRIIGFHQDRRGQWIAELGCGHVQYVRHAPPWINRPWVTTAEGRRSALGKLLTCRKCEASVARELEEFAAAITTIRCKIP